MKYILLPLILLFLSCTTAKYSNLTYFKDYPDYEIIDTFSLTIEVSEFFGASGGANINNISADFMDEKVLEEIKNIIILKEGDAVFNVEIKQYITPLDMALNIISASLYAPVTVYVSGDVVRFLD